MKTWFEPREVLFPFGELDLGFRTLVADFEFWTQVVDFGFGTLVADVEFWTQVADFGCGALVADFGFWTLMTFSSTQIFGLFRKQEVTENKNETNTRPKSDWSLTWTLPAGHCLKQKTGILLYQNILKFVQVFWKLFSLTWLSCLARDMQLT